MRILNICLSKKIVCCGNTKVSFARFVFCFTFFLFAALPWNTARAQALCTSDADCALAGDLSCVKEELSFCRVSDGTCIHFVEERGVPCDSDDNPCTENICGGGAFCEFTPANEGGACESDNFDCTIDVCDANGQCVHNGRVGVPCDSDNSSCTVEGCMGGVESPYCQLLFTESNGAFCNDEITMCTFEVCLDGVCDINPFPGSPGNPCESDDDACTTDRCGEDDNGNPACLHIAIDCFDGYGCTDDACNPDNGTCLNISNCPSDNNPCTDDFCGFGVCRYEQRNCNDNNACTLNDLCNAVTGNCFSIGEKFCVASPCTTATCDPATGDCIYTFDCNEGSGCCNDGDVCTTDICQGNGTCSNVPVNCDDHNACTLNDLCNSASGCYTLGTKTCDAEACSTATCNPATGDCIYTFDCRTGATCCEDANACTTEECQSNGTCAPVNCADTDLCTQDGCEPTTGCYNFEWCTADSDPCTIDTCVRICDPADCILCPILGEPYCTNCNNCQNSSPICYTIPKCDDDNPCTEDICDNGNCQHNSLTGNACTDDGNACTDDVCNNGVCQHTNNDVACTDDGNACTLDYCGGGDCTHFEKCDDNDACTSNHCDAQGICSFTPVNCSDGVNCTDDECDRLTGCRNTPNCNDNNACTFDICNGTSCIFPSVNCNDGNSCTQDGCDAVTGCYNNAWCADDGDLCTTETCYYDCGLVCELCSSLGDPFCDICSGCLNGPPSCISIPKCDDGNSCTDDVCTDGVCEYRNSNAACTDDGNLCTQDVCNAGACSHPAVVCASDGDGCTQESCEPSTGCFSYPPCLDFDACTEDICNAGVCQYIHVVCEDNDPSDCDYEICISGTCQRIFIPNGSLCDDNPCTSAVCDDGDCIRENLAPGTTCTDDGTVCTGDYCSGGVCIHEPATQYFCETDNNACTEDICGNGTGICTHPAITCEDDGNFCTEETCLPASGCTSTPKTCTDGDLCTIDRCLPASGCFYEPVICDDGVACTTDDCNNGTCTHDSASCPIDCVVSEWSDWSNCSASCGGGTQCRTRTVITRAANGGAACPILEECRPCNQQSCDPCFGFPNLTVRGLTLMYEHFIGAVGPLTQGKVIDKDTLCRFNIRADVCPQLVGSVKFQLTGAQTMTKIEGTAPYAAFGDSPTGDYNPWSPPVGNYTLKVTAYTGANGGGTAGTPLTIQFSVVDGTGSTSSTCATRPTVNCTALNCNDNNPCTTDNCNPQTGCVNTPKNCNDNNACTTESCASGTCIYIPVLCDDGNACTIDQCASASGCFYTAKNCNDFNACTTEECNTATGNCINNPITCSDNNTCTVDACHPTNGCYYTPTGNCCTLNTQCDDNNLCTVDVCNGGTCFNNLVGQRVVTSFTLVNATTNLDIGPIDNNSIINLALTPNVNIRANLCTNTGTESIRFKVNSNNNFRTESDVPYALAGDAPPGDYHKWNVTPGVYTITATPYAGNNATSTVGTPKSITITVVNGAPKMSGEEELTTATEHDVELAAYPNPFREKLTIEFMLRYDSKVALEVFSVSGQRLAVLFEGNVTRGELQKMEYFPASGYDGMVIYRLQTGQEILYGKAVMVK